jgi:hypothetical protein
MARTFGGFIFYDAASIVIPAASNGVAAGQYSLVRNAIGDWSYNNAAGVGTVVFQPDDSNMARPYFTFPAYPGQGTVPLSNEFQEVFGTAAGGPGNPMSGLASGSQAVGGGVFGTPNLPWGIAVIDLVAVYSVQTAALTTATLTLNRNIFAENVATTNTAVVAAQNVALTTTTSATTPHVQKFTLPQPLVYETADMSTLIMELLITTAATSAVRVYGIGIHYAVEYS